MVNNAFAYTFKKSRLASTGRTHSGHHKRVDEISTNMRFLTCKMGIRYLALTKLLKILLIIHL